MELDDLAKECLEGRGEVIPLHPAQHYSPAPTMGKLQRVKYSHDAMIDLILTRPGITQTEIAATYGYTPAWVSNIIASDAFQAKLADRREQFIDPVIKASIEERLKGLVVRSIAVLNEKLDQPQVSDKVALRALELGAKGLGIGGHAPQKPTTVNLYNLKERLLAIRGEVYPGEAVRVEEKEA